ncbi:MAG: hypothetical protein NTU57_05320 [Candidatus Aenigmarchaeota archaeon]|nr:hypothetical protein [Candidatus Aenigmarchaeota archaeon]
MFELLKSMMKEEWRSHSTMFGSMMFALFPVMIAIFSFAGSLFLPLFTTILAADKIALLAHYTFVIFGLSVGAFGLSGREIINRRFGQASLIAYSSKSLPVSERKIFMNFCVKDVIYYFTFWILPFMAGLAFALPFMTVSLDYLLVFSTLSLSFFIGLSAMFLLSTLYAHSSRILFGLLAIIGVPLIFLGLYFGVDLPSSLPSFSFFVSRSWEDLAFALFLIVVPSAVSLAFPKMDYPEKKRMYRNSLAGLSKKLDLLGNSHFISKDIIDMQRSEGGLGKILFAFIFPVAFIWVLLFVFLKFVPIADFLLVFSILLGVLASSIYEWLTEFDIFTSYVFLPVKVSTLMKSKIKGYAIINIVPLSILFLTAIWLNQLQDLVIAMAAFLSVSSFTLSIKIYLTGLYPNILLYSAKIFVMFLFAASPVLLPMIILSIINPLYLLASPVLMLLSFYIIKKGFAKWDKTESVYF